MPSDCTSLFGESRRRILWHWDLKVWLWCCCFRLWPSDPRWGRTFLVYLGRRGAVRGRLTSAWPSGARHPQAREGTWLTHLPSWEAHPLSLQANPRCLIHTHTHTHQCVQTHQNFSHKRFLHWLESIFKCLKWAVMNFYRRETHKDAYISQRPTPFSKYVSVT